MKDSEILAVHKNKLEEFLKGLDINLWNKFSKGELHCYSCGTIITLENIGFILPKRNEIVICCSNIECLYKKDEEEGT